MVNKRIIRTILIIVLIVSILFNTLLYSATAQVIRLSSNVNVIWGEESEKPIVPRDEMRSLNLTILYSVDSGGDFSNGVLYAYAGMAEALIQLSIIDHSPWCSVNLESTVVPITLTTGISETSIFLNLLINDNAPAYGEGFVKIHVAVPTMKKIKGFSKEFTLPFIAAYLPRISIKLPESNTKQIGPIDNAVFPIEIENLGNARTKVFLTIQNIPQGWTVAVTDDVALDEVEGSKATAYLTIKPPKDIGYHYDEESFQVLLTPARAENLLDTGDTLSQTFIVQSRGFSTPGFELVLFFSALLVVVIIAERKKKK